MFLKILQSPISLHGVHYNVNDVIELTDVTTSILALCKAGRASLHDVAPAVLLASSAEAKRPAIPLEQMTKKQLLDVASSRDIHIDPTLKKADVLQLLKG